MGLTHEIPPGFRTVSGKRSPPHGTQWNIALRNGWHSTDRVYAAEALCWIHGGHSGDVIAVREPD